jgi:DNA polymerase epsilon subunit 1
VLGGIEGRQAMTDGEYSANANFDLFDDDPRTDDRRNNASFAEASDFIVDIREYDVPYHVRVMIDMGMLRP